MPEIVDPQCYNLWYSMRRYYVDRFMVERAGMLSSLAKVLEIGGVRSGIRGAFRLREFVDDVVTVNIEKDADVDAYVDAMEMPFVENAFQGIVCMEVMEHVREPDVVLRECARVLQPGGVLLITAPFMTGFHAAPHDYLRFTSQYWKDRLGALNFANIEVLPMGGGMAVSLDMLRRYYLYPPAFVGLSQRCARFFLKHLFSFLRRYAVRRESAFAGESVSATTGFGVCAVLQ